MDNPTQNEPENKPVTFTYHWYPRLAGAVCTLMFGVCSAVTILQVWDKPVDLFTAAVFPALSFLGLVLLLWTNKRWTVRDDGIVTRSWYGREELHYWIDMDRVEGVGLGSGIRIKNKSGQTVLSLDPWIKNYDDFVEVLRLRRKELFAREVSLVQIQTLKRNPAVVVAGIVFCLAVIGLAVFWMVSGQLPYGIGALLFGCWFLYLISRIPLAVHLLEDTLRLDYLRGGRTIQAADIYNIYTRSSRDYQGGAGASAIIELKNGKKFELAGYKEGTPMVMNVLRNWLEEYVAAHPEPEEQEILREEGGETGSDPFPTPPEEG